MLLSQLLYCNLLTVPCPHFQKHLHLFAAQAQQQNLVETNPLLSDRSWVNQEQERYRNLMRKVEIELGLVV